MLPPGTYDGKVAFVTGGGTGLGKGMATKFAELGASVVISSRKLENLEKAAEEIVQQVPNGKLYFFYFRSDRHTSTTKVSAS